MKNHYLLDRPAVVSFSGGRTSGYMLWQILQAFGGELPDDVKVIFTNTGKERRETLEFVERCSQRWSVPITWLEYTGRGNLGFRQVDHATASRDGTPFATLIRHKQRLPNQDQRFCTQWLKILTTYRYCVRTLGWESFTEAVGLRADEPHRVAKLAPNEEEAPGRYPVAPLHRAGATLADVTAFWQGQRGGVPLKDWLGMLRPDRPGWDLELMPDEGNCDLCFLKGRGKAKRLIRQWPDAPDWWIAQERLVSEKTGSQARFRKGLSVVAMVAAAAQPDLPFTDESDFPSCGCTD